MSELPPNQMKVTIFNKEYCVSCPEGQEDKLAEVADFLNQRMREMKNSGTGLGADQIAAITALNLAHELLEQRREQQLRQHEQQSSSDEVHDRLKVIKDRLDTNMFQRRMRTGQLHQF